MREADRALGEMIAIENAEMNRVLDEFMEAYECRARGISVEE